MFENRKTILMALMLAATSVAGCGSSTPTCTASSGAVTWASVQPIFTSNCTSCHNGFGAPGGISFATEASAASNAQLAVDAMSSGRMPPGGSVSDSDICKVQAWISQGLKP